MSPLLNFQTYTLEAGTWTSIYLSGKVLRAWLSFASDIIIGSSETSDDQICFAEGKEVIAKITGLACA